VLGPVAADAAEMVAVDRLGFKLRVRAGDGLEGCRIGFPREVTDTAQCRRVLIEMVEECRKRVASGV
jgi:putative heme iron utilization protein